MDSFPLCSTLHTALLPRGSILGREGAEHPEQVAKRHAWDPQLSDLSSVCLCPYTNMAEEQALVPSPKGAPLVPGDS